MFGSTVPLYLWYFISLLNLIHSLNALSALNGSLPACKLEDYKYDFTECDSFGGRWRVSVPVAPNKCTSSGSGDNHSPPNLVSIPGPIRVNRCYSACESGQYFNTSSLLCVGCPAGHYSLGGGVLFESFNQSGEGGLPEGFNIRTESNLHTPEMDKLCSGWYVEPSTGQLVSSTNSEDSSPNSFPPSSTLPPSSLTCISVLTYTVKVVKSGRLRFEYRYRIPADLSTLLFSFHYRLYTNGGIFEGDGPGGQFARRYPMPTVEQQQFEVNEVTFDRPGLYVFTWRSVFVDHPRGGPGGRFELNSNSNNNQAGQGGGLFKESNLFSLGFIRLKKILVEGIAYASECTPCGPGTYAPAIRSRQCTACPPNTAHEGTGATVCAPCDPTTEYATRGSVRCRKRPLCGLNDFYSIPVDQCNSTTRQQRVVYRWIEPRICLDSKGVFPGDGERVVNCTTTVAGDSHSCDLGMDLQADTGAPNGNSSSKFCQFCPEGSYRGDYSSPSCTPCPPFTSPYYALSVFRWNSSLPSWSTPNALINSSSLDEQEEYFAESNKYLNAYFSRLCIHTDEEDGGNSGDSMDVSKRTEGDASEDSTTSNSNTRVEECDSRNTWQPFADYIRTGASSMLDSYLIFSVAIPGFRSNAGGELSFVFETFCDAGDSCSLMFVETRADEGEVADLVSRQLQSKLKSAAESSAISRQKYLFMHSSNNVLKEWYQSTEGGRLSYRHRVEGGNVSLIYSWVFKRTTSFQSYAKVYSFLLTNSLAGSAIQCKTCPISSSTMTSATSNQCVTCPEGQYLEDGEDGDKEGHSTVVRTSVSVESSSGHPQCRQCPENYVVNRSLALPIGRRASCIPCGPGLGTAGGEQYQNVCFSNCSVTFPDGDRYELGELGTQLEYRGGSMFTAGGTQFLHLFRISLCGHPKTAKLSTCQNNITDMYEDQNNQAAGSSGVGGSGGIRAFICRSTIIPDSPGVIYTTQSFSLGDELIAITRDASFNNISVHSDFLQHGPYQKTTSKDYHLFFRTRTVTTGACPQGRQMTVTMRCSGGDGVKKDSSTTTVISTPKSCPAGTCDGCTFHLMIETPSAAACRLCRPFNSEDFDTVVGECVDGFQQVHYINPKGCVVLNEAASKLENNVLTRPCTVLLPRHIQIAISVVIALGLLLLLLVFHFWNQNRSLEYKYSKLIEHSGGGKNGEDDDDDGDLSFDNCCAEMDGGEEEEDRGKQLEQNNNNNNLSNNRLDKTKALLGSSKEMQTLFGSPKGEHKPNNQQHHLDEEGYETIHLTPASAAMAAAKGASSKKGVITTSPNQIV